MKKQKKTNDDKIIDKILNKSKDIQTVANDTFLAEYAKLHNVNPKNSIMDLKQEVVAKRAFFTDVKKRYAMYIINKEGVAVSKYDIKGIETQRSDYPNFTKQKLQELLDLLIKDDDYSPIKIKEFVDKTKEEVIELCAIGSKQIARPVAFSTELSEYKVVPSHVEGMLLWNNLEYEYFAAGTRGRQFKIKGVNNLTAPDRIKKVLHHYKNNNNIVIPEEEDKLPDYYILDVEDTVNFCWTARVNNLLKCFYDNIFSENKRKSQPKFDIF